MPRQLFRDRLTAAREFQERDEGVARAMEAHCIYLAPGPDDALALLILLRGKGSVPHIHSSVGLRPDVLNHPSSIVNLPTGHHGSSHACWDT